MSRACLGSSGQVTSGVRFQNIFLVGGQTQVACTGVGGEVRIECLSAMRAQRLPLYISTGLAGLYEFSIGVGGNSP
jgi:hypothetical protein